MQTYAWTSMGMRESTAGVTLFVKSHEIPDAPSPQLLKKIATMISYQDELFSGHRESNREMMRSMLDDPEVAQWLDRQRKNGGVDHTRFSQGPNLKRKNG